jgi:hypothetical protein
MELLAEDFTKEMDKLFDEKGLVRTLSDYYADVEILIAEDKPYDIIWYLYISEILILHRIGSYVNICFDLIMVFTSINMLYNTYHIRCVSTDRNQKCSIYPIVFMVFELTVLCFMIIMLNWIVLYQSSV